MAWSFSGRAQADRLAAAPGAGYGLPENCQWANLGDRPKALVIVKLLDGVDDQLAAALTAAVSDKATEQTTGELRARLRRLLLAARRPGHRGGRPAVRTRAGSDSGTRTSAAEEQYPGGMTALLDRLIEHPLTEDDLDEVSQALRGTGIHYELHNGRLLLMSPMKWWHADVSARVRAVLVKQGRIAAQEQGVRISRRKVRFPDVAAFRELPDPDAGRHDPSDFTLVVEVISDDSVEEDRVTKRTLYAAAGIPEYWIVDRHPDDRRDAVIEFFKLGQAGQYERSGEAVLTELEAKYATR